MPEPHSPPRLSVVDELPTADPADPGEVRSRRGPRPGWLLLVAALLLAWLWLTQLDRSQALERQISGLESELAGAQAELASWQQRMHDIATGLDGLTAQLAALQLLAAERADPATVAEPEPSAPGEPGPLARP